MDDKKQLTRIGDRLNMINAIQEKLEKEKLLLIKEYAQIYMRLNNGQKAH
jgi:hypothetical protein